MRVCVYGKDLLHALGSGRLTAKKSINSASAPLDMKCLSLPSRSVARSKFTHCNTRMKRKRKKESRDGSKFEIS